MRAAVTGRLFEHPRVEAAACFTELTLLVKEAAAGRFFTFLLDFLDACEGR